MSAGLRKSLADVTRRKGRTLLVVLGIFIGVAGLTAINFIEDAIFSAYAYGLGIHADFPDIVLDVDRLDPALLPGLNGVPNIQMVQYQTIFRTEWYVSRAPGHVEMAIDSYPELQQHPLTPFELTSGRLPGPGEILMDSSNQSIQPVKVGDTVSVNAPGGPTALRVVGLTRRPGTAGSERGLGFMSAAGLRQLTGDLDAAAPGKRALTHSILIRVDDAAQTQATAGAVQGALGTGNVQVLGTIFPKGGPAPVSQIDGIFALLRILILLAVLMTGLLIVNTVSTLVAEQTAIIGTMKAVGGTRRAIMRGYLASVGLYSLLATLPGLLLGLAGGYLLASNLAATIPLDLGPFAVAPWIILLSLTVGFAVPLFAALVPLWMGTRISVREALAAYGVSAGAGGDRLARLGTRLPWVSQTAWMGLRGMFRKPGRTALTLLTLVVACTCFLVVQTASSSVNGTVALAHTIMAADVDVRLPPSTPFGPIRDQLRALPNVAQVERFDGNHVTTSWGDLGIVAVEPGTQLYHYQLLRGRVLRPGDTDAALLSDAAAARTGLSVGSTLALPNQAGPPITLTIVGIVKQPIDVLGWIGAAVVPIDTLYRLEGVPAGQITSTTHEVVVQARDRGPQAVAALATTIDAALNPSGGASANPDQAARIETLADYVARRQATWFTLYALLYAVAFVVGVAGVLGLANALTAAVLERRREIGLLRVLGARSGQVAQVFWVEALGLGGLAWAAGALLGLPLAWIFVGLLSRWVLPVDFAVDPAAFAVMLLAVLIIATLASAGPALHATRLRIAGILRYE